MPIDIEEAKANDTVGQEFEAHYIPNTTAKQLQEAKALMTKLLKKYGNREKLDADEIDSKRYREAMYVVYSRSKDEMIATNEARKKLIERKNLLSKFFDENRDILFGLSVWQRINLRKYTDEGLLIDQEYLDQMLQEMTKEEIIHHLANIANYIYNDTGFQGGVREDYDALRRGPVRSIYHKSTCKAQKTVHPDCGCCDDRGAGYT